jgi:hypothetical protein
MMIAKKDVEFRIMPSGNGPEWGGRQRQRRDWARRDTEPAACAAADDAAREANLVEE